MSLQTTTTRPCSGRSSDKKTIPQTLFLGASVSNFTCNLGWGQQPSSVNINLVNDKSPYCGDTQLSMSGAGTGADDHYYDNDGDALYIGRDPNTGRGILPGKMYYQWSTSLNKFVSKYRTTEDPGFFGVNNNWLGDNTGYDIIGNPVCFKMMDFEFSGLVKNWEYSDSSGGGTTSITIESPNALLSNSYLIISDYSGCVFGKTGSMNIGGPKNWSKSGLTNTGTVSQGAIHNLFNVFGYLENSGFGDSRINDQGVPASLILDALQILTSTTPIPQDGSVISRFSPFGRIIGRTAMILSNETSVPNNFYGYGLFPPTTATDGRLRHQYVLDLSEVPRPDSAFRLTGPVISIMDLITQITDVTARDFFIDLIPYHHNGSILPMIKVRTVNRASQPMPQLVKGIIETISTSYQVSNRSYGQEQGEATNRAMLIGGSQQRLFQAKNYRLAYKQTNYCYDAATNSFINYKAFPNSKWREPSVLSTRMPDVSDAINPSFSWLFGDELTIKNTVENVGIYTTSTAFEDTTNGPGATNVVLPAPGAGIIDGNYASTGNQAACEISTPSNAITPICQPTDGAPLQIGNPSVNIRNRFVPLFNDIITPFFGFRFEKGTGSTEGLPEESLKQARPVYLDAMTGQLMVVCDVQDLPPLKYGIKNVYSGNRFVVSESEMRAAMAGFDNLVLYYAAKTYKPDLILMLQKTYLDTGASIIDSDDTPMGLSAWGMVEDQNAAGDDGFSVAPYADQDEDVNVTNILYSRSFTEDLMLLHQFISDIAEKYYGKTYSVRVPNVLAYRDWTSGGTQNIGEASNPIYVWTGAPKVFYNYEIASDGAWEEPGNYIDDKIVVGSQDYYSLVDETGRIQPILGYNASDNFDSTAYALCSGGHLFKSANRIFKNSPVFGVDTYSMHVNQFSGGCDHAKFYYPSIDLSSVSEDVLIKNTEMIQSPFNTHNIQGRKAYIKAQVRPDFYFTDPSSFGSPRAIIESPGLFLNNSSLEYSQDPNKTVISNVALEDLMTYIMTNPANLIKTDIVKCFSSRLSHLYNGTLLRTKHKKQENAQMVDLAPKAAHPFFAAIPLKSNRFVYGPWVNYPDKEDDSGLVFGSDKLENAVANIRVESDQDLVPWNYGGVSMLDKVAMMKLTDMTTYQNIIESGGFEIPGLPIFGLGSKIFTGAPNGTLIYGNQGFNPTTDSGPNGEVVQVLGDSLFDMGNPVITNMQVSVSESKISTSYSLKIYSKPLSRFNKEAADRLKKIASDSIKRNQRDASNTKKLMGQQVKTLQDSVARRQSGFTGYSTQGASKKLLGWSPVGVIIGAGSYYSSSPTKGDALGIKTANQNQRNRTTGVDGDNQQNSTPTSAGLFRGSRGDWNITASFNGSNANVPYDQAQGPINTMLKDLRHSSNLYIYQGKESGLASLKDYGDKAMMSLDGILSPVSFYTGRYSSCYSMAKWPQSKCPICCGEKIYTEPVTKYSSDGTYTSVQVQKFCDYCYDDTFTTPDKTIKEKRNDLLSIPPYILVKNTSDTTVLSKLDTKFNNETKPSKNQIGMTTLQPILQSNGDFKNKYAQDIDKKRHSISIVGRGGVNHGEALAGITDIIIKNNLEDNKYGNNADFNGSVDLRLQSFLSKTAAANTANIAGNCPNINSYPLNNRFIGLRGPLVLHGWGYDLEGYPVPNAGDEPKEVDINGRFKRHKKVQSRDLDGNLLTDKDGNPVYEDDYEHLGDFPGGSLSANELGSVIGKTQEYVNGKWTPPKRSDKFYLNWGERPDLWPVGPIDLRWDEERKVWTAPQPKVYKNVYITLEEDLDTVQNPEDTLKPARGFISDLEYETTSENHRKIVFVVDQSGYTAPRGAKLLCYYNPDKGFYEVLTRPTYTVLGTIQSNGSQATINLSYIQSKNRSILTDNTLTTTFNNPLGFNVTGGQRGLFTYIDGSWTLTSTNT